MYLVILLRVSYICSLQGQCYSWAQFTHQLHSVMCQKCLWGNQCTFLIRKFDVPECRSETPGLELVFKAAVKWSRTPDPLSARGDGSRLQAVTSAHQKVRLGERAPSFLLLLVPFWTVKRLMGSVVMARSETVLSQCKVKGCLCFGLILKIKETICYLCSNELIWLVSCQKMNVFFKRNPFCSHLSGVTLMEVVSTWINRETNWACGCTFKPFIFRVCLFYAAVNTNLSSCLFALMFAFQIKNMIPCWTAYQAALSFRLNSSYIKMWQCWMILCIILCNIARCHA